MERSKRFLNLKKKNINQDSFFTEWPEAGLAAMQSVFDPPPGIVMEGGRIVEMDGKKRDDFDSIECFIAEYGIDLAYAPEAMAMDSLQIARKIVDINVSREEVVRIASAITPAKMLQVMNHLNVVEMMMGQMKMRVRKTPANQAHVTNIKDHPVLLAADAAEAAFRGFAEIETTCAVSRYAPLNAIALLIGGQIGKKGVLSQCSLEESTELKMGMRGLTTYAETVSIYGTEEAMDDGDDTAWSKAFLASAYASRGIKMRFTSGTGSEVLLGHSEKKSMLYLEIRCIYLAKACGVQGLQNGSISCIGIATAVPEGFRAISAESLAASMLNLEVASGNDQTFSHSDMRRTAKLLLQMLPGTDFITSGYSATPNFDDIFAGSNTDCDDYDDYYMFQRDMQIDGGIEPVTEEEVKQVRSRAANACQKVFEYLGLPEVSDQEVEAAIYAYSNEEMPNRKTALDLMAAQELMTKGTHALDVTVALHRQGFHDAAENVLSMLRERVAGDYLHTAAIFNRDFKLLSALNDANDYLGPGTGYRISQERWEKLKKKTFALQPEEILQKKRIQDPAPYWGGFRERSPAGFAEDEIIISLSPAFAAADNTEQMIKIHISILEEMMRGIREAGMKARVIRVYHTCDLAQLAFYGATTAKSGIGIGLQFNGAVMIQEAQNHPPDCLEFIYNVPFTNTRIYRQIGINAVSYARKQTPEPVSELLKPGGLTKYQLRMICRNPAEFNRVVEDKAPMELMISEGL